MTGCSSWTTKRRALVWRLGAGLLAASATILLVVPAATAASTDQADQAPAMTAQTAAPPVQSCNDAYDQTGVGGAGIGQIHAVGNGVYAFDIKFNQDFILAHPPATIFESGEARVFVNNVYAFTIPTGHPRPIRDSFHSTIKLQGYKYGRGNKKSIQRGNLLSFRIYLLLVDPVSGTLYPGHGTITCEL